MFVLYEEFRSTPWEGDRMAESGLGHSMWKGPELDRLEEEGVPSFSFPIVFRRISWILGRFPRNTYQTALNQAIWWLILILIRIWIWTPIQISLSASSSIISIIMRPATTSAGYSFFSCVTIRFFAHTLLANFSKSGQVFLDQKTENFLVSSHSLLVQLISIVFTKQNNN